MACVLQQVAWLLLTAQHSAYISGRSLVIVIKDVFVIAKITQGTVLKHNPCEGLSGTRDLYMENVCV